MATMIVNPFSGEPSYYEEGEPVPQNTWGGKRRESKTKTNVALSLDNKVLEWIDKFGQGKNRSAKINTILKTHIKHIEQMIKEADELMNEGL